MDGETLYWSLGFNHRMLERNMAGLDHSDCLVQPPDGNCINWILGHLVGARGSILNLLGTQLSNTDERIPRYGKGSAVITAEDADTIPLDELQHLLEKSEEDLKAAFSAATPERLAEPTGETTVGERVNFLLMHEAYHIGQIGLLRRIAGKGGTV